MQTDNSSERKVERLQERVTAIYKVLLTRPYIYFHQRYQKKRKKKIIYDFEPCVAVKVQKKQETQCVIHMQMLTPISGQLRGNLATAAGVSSL